MPLRTAFSCCTVVGTSMPIVNRSVNRPSEFRRHFCVGFEPHVEARLRALLCQTFATGASDYNG